jgi:small subunit ribosomal protein S5
MKKSKPESKSEPEAEAEAMPEAVVEVPENPEEIVQAKPELVVTIEGWTPKTDLGRKVKKGEITSFDDIIAQGYKILEPEIVDTLLPGMESELLLIGQSKGKFGGGQRRVFKQTQKKTKEGNKPKFATVAVIGNKNGIVGVGFGKAKETVPAKEKALRNAKLNLIRIKRGSGSWESRTSEEHSIPFAVEGKCGSIRIKLIPAPKGKGLVAEKEVAKILKLAGITDIWTKTRGQTKNRINMVKAVMDALKKLHSTKVMGKV